MDNCPVWKKEIIKNIIKGRIYPLGVFYEE